MALEKSGTRIGNTAQTTFVPVWATVIPESVDEVCDAVRRSSGRLSVSSARYSPDTQFALDGALHLDLSRLNRVIRFEPVDGLIRVQAGIRWHELLRFIQPHGFAPRTMPQFANFGVGGSVSSNAHGTFVGVGPISHSVRSLRVVLANGTLVEASPAGTPDLFSAIVGGMGGIGIIVEVELALTLNTRLLRKSLAMPGDQYVDYFKARIASDPGAVFHSADFYPPAFSKLRATTWVVTDERCTDDQPLHLAGIADPLRRVFDWSRTPSWFGRLRKELIVEPLRFARKSVHWRNYEASHDLLELDSRIHGEPLLELQEYVVAGAHVGAFLSRLREIVARYRVPALHLSIRHYGHCDISCLSLSERDAFSLVLAVRSRPADSLKADYAVWSRELVDAALDCDGSFNPAYVMHATAEQFRAAFPRREELLVAKRKYDPGNRFGNGLWTRYLGDDADRDPAAPAEVSEFRAVFAHAGSRDTVYRLLAECGPRGYAPRMLGLLQRMSERTGEDELIYRNMRASLLKWRASLFAPLTLRPTGWPRDLHRRLARFARDRLKATPGFDGRRIDGLIEVGTDGLQSKALRRILAVEGRVTTLDLSGAATGRGASRWIESRLPARTAIGEPVGWEGGRDGDEDGRRAAGGADEGSAASPVDLVTLFGGLAGMPAALLARCLFRLTSALRPGGLLLLLEHDVDRAQAGLDASMAVTIACLCGGDTWEDCQSHPRAFRAADDWAALLGHHGLFEIGERERIGRTPFGDVLMAFRKGGDGDAPGDA